MIRLTGIYSDYGKDIEGDGKFEDLIINIEVIQANEGNCFADVRLVDMNGKEIAWASNTSHLIAGKPQNMQLDFDGRYIYWNKVNGPYCLRDVYVYHTGDPNYPDYASNAYNTSAYLYSDFQGSGISITGTKFNDINNNSSRESNEPSLSNWMIDLTRQDNTLVTTITDTNGNYSFNDVAPGTYIVSEELKSGWNQTYPSDPGTYTVTIVKDNFTGIDFGNYNAPPNTPSVPSGPGTGYAWVSYSYTTSAIDPGDQVMYTFDWGDGATSETDVVDSGTSESASHTWTKTGKYQVKAKATDSKGLDSEWSSSLTVTIKVNNQPNTPSKPSGSNSGYTGASYSYTTSAKDLNKDRVKYTFDWGDGTPNSVTSLVNSGTAASVSHSWGTAGKYQVKAMATDSKGASSGWSSPLAVTIAVNNPPNTPSQPKGPASGKPRTSYSYSTSATDPNGDKMKYTFNWGDGTTYMTGLVNSGKSASASHKWSKGGTYQVTAMATDCKGASSGWSSPLAVKIGSWSSSGSDQVSPIGPFPG